MKREISIFLAAVIFLAFGVLAIDFLRKPPSHTKEGFESGPTRASDCSCRLDYVPSNKLPQMENGGSILHYKGAIIYAPAGVKNEQGTLNAYHIPNCTMCGMNFCSPSTYTNITQEKEFKKYKVVGTFTCKIMEDAKKRKESSTFFCQRFGDPTDTLPCF